VIGGFPAVLSNFQLQDQVTDRVGNYLGKQVERVEKESNGKRQSCLDHQQKFNHSLSGVKPQGAVCMRSNDEKR